LNNMSPVKLETKYKALQKNQASPSLSQDLATEYDSILVLDFGSQYTQLLARRIRELGVFAKVLPWNTSRADAWKKHVKGIVLSGGPASVYDPGAPFLQSWILESGVPVLGICYGMQLLVHSLGGDVRRDGTGEYGRTEIVQIDGIKSPLFEQVVSPFVAWMSHMDNIKILPSQFNVLAYGKAGLPAAIGNTRYFGLQFHPEVSHTQYGNHILRNFVLNVCECLPEWKPKILVDDILVKLRAEIGGEKVLCAVSGGVDSAVTARLLQMAVGDQLTCLFVDTGLLREGEKQEVMSLLKDRLHLNVLFFDKSKSFLEGLLGVVDPEEKRRIIGEKFVRIFEDFASCNGGIHFLAQGTLYPDVIESGAAESGAAARIKAHHNVGGLPAQMGFRLIEPLRFFFKDEVRKIGGELRMPRELIKKQPFPGPGLAVRILGKVTKARVQKLRIADSIVREEIEKAGLSEKVWQYFAVLAPIESVGVKGDQRSFHDTIIVRAVESEDAMTAEWSPLPYEVLRRISSRITNEVPEIGRVVYDITDKPPGTIEWQ
jgi:GMP synthase (glutamine-hydrolysing)